MSACLLSLKRSWNVSFVYCIRRKFRQINAEKEWAKCASKLSFVGKAYPGEQPAEHGRAQAGGDIDDADEGLGGMENGRSERADAWLSVF
jgi:hypothetical protein